MKTQAAYIMKALANIFSEFRIWSTGKKDTTLTYVAILLAFTSWISKSAYAEELFVVNSLNQLVRVETTDLSAPISTVALTGVTAGETLSDIDFRPVNGSLIGIGTLGNTYLIDAVNGVATKINSSPLGVTPSGTIFSIDLNPSVDRIRFVSNTGQNFRINPETGAVAGTDTVLAFAQGDPNSSKTPGVTGNAYTDDFAGTSSTTLYAIDSTNNLLLRQGSFGANPVSPNAGTLFTIGALGETISGAASFDISAETGLAYAAFLRSGKTVPELFVVSLGTGKLTLLGDLPISGTVKGIALPTLPGRFLTLASDSGISFINVDAPSQQFKNRTVTGLQPGETILGIDYRPATDELFALGSQSRIYTLNATTGVATVVGAGFTPVLAGTEFGFDFNPVADRIRVVSDSGANFRLNPLTGALVAADGNLTYAAGDLNFGSSGKGVGLAYSQSTTGSLTTAYLIDSQVGILTTLGGVGGSPSPNLGQLQTVGSLPAAITTDTGFDITPNEKTGYLNLGSSLYEIDPTTGKGFLRGTTPANKDIAALPAATFAFSSGSATVQESAGSVSVVVNRTRNLIGTAYVPYKTVSGSAVSGTDFADTFGVLTFVDGEAVKSISLKVSNDSTKEASEGFKVQLLQPFGGVLGTQTETTVNVLDSIDTDSDGFSNALEVLAGTDPLIAASNPVGAAGAVAPKAISTARLSLSFDLSRTGRDSISYTGRLGGISSNFNPSGKNILIEVAGFTKKFRINSRLVGASRGSSIRLTKIRGGYSYALSVPRIDLISVLEDQGISRETENKTKFVVPTAVVFDQRLYAKDITVTYTVAKAVRATARN